MSPYKRSDSPFYYISVTLSDGRTITRSSRKTSKREARQVEALIRELDKAGEHDLLDRVHAGELRPDELLHASRAGRLERIQLDEEDPPLRDVLRKFESYDPYDATKRALDKVREVAPEDARRSWLTDPKSLRDLLAYYRDEGYAAGTERRDMATVSKLLDHEFGPNVRNEVFGRIKMRSADNRIVAHLDAEEMVAIRERASRRMWALISTAAATGLRLSEELRLTVRDVPWEENAVLVREQKGGGSRRVPLRGQPKRTLKAYVEHVGARGRDRIWPDLTNGKVWHRWDAIRKDLDLKRQDGEWFRWHDLRHHFAVHMARQGVPLPELRDLLGHSSLDMVARYALYVPFGREEQHRAALREMGLEGEISASDPQPDYTAGEEAGGVGT